MSMMHELPTHFDAILKDDPRMESYREDTMFRGCPEAVIRARDERDLREAVRYCFAHRLPMTFCGSRTSMTGASIPIEGVLISTERLDGVLQIDRAGSVPTVTVRAGTVVAELQRSVTEAGFFYPVSPTSRDSCLIGGNVATNATGEDSFQYGPVRPYVRRVKVILADGTEQILERSRKSKELWQLGRGGLFLGGEQPIDLFIGSEGTLGAITEVTLELLPCAPDFFAMLIPFADQRTGLRFLVDVATGKFPLRPRALEFIDRAALDIMKTAPESPYYPSQIKAVVYVKQEYRDAEDMNLWCDRWNKAVSDRSGDKYLNKFFVATTAEQQRDFQRLRHFIPKRLNEQARAFWPAGGGKVGSDWWVPVEHLIPLLDFFYAEADRAKLFAMAYAHMGNGHPHTNLIAENAAEKCLAMDILRACCRKAVELGGGIAGEHGIGKLNRHLLPLQHTAAALAQMRIWKRHFDPHALLGRGNIFS